MVKMAIFNTEYIQEIKWIMVEVGTILIFNTLEIIYTIVLYNDMNVNNNI